MTACQKLATKAAQLRKEMQEAQERGEPTPDRDGLRRTLQAAPYFHKISLECLHIL